jgi:hypothetical protein
MSIFQLRHYQVRLRYSHKLRYRIARAVISSLRERPSTDGVDSGAETVRRSAPSISLGEELRRRIADDRRTGADANGDLGEAETVADLGPISLEDELKWCVLLAEHDPSRFERAASHWLERFVAEQEPPAADVALAASALEALPHDAAAGTRALEHLVRRA